MNKTKILLTLTEVGMILYWLLAFLLLFKIVHIPPEYMYSDYLNPVIIAWNWSFFPIDIIFAITGLVGRFGTINKQHKTLLSVISLSLMFCAGLMAISFWAINRDFHPVWWGLNLWLIMLSFYMLLSHFKQ